MATRTTSSGNRNSSTRKGSTTGRSKVAKTPEQQELEDSYLDTVPVITADGEEHILAELDPTPVDDEFDVAQPEPTVRPQRKAASKGKATASRGKSSVTPKLTAAQQRDADRAQKAADKALAEAARLREELKAQKAKAAEQAKKAKADAAQAKKDAAAKAKAEKAAEREKAREEARQKREEAKAERARLRSLAKGETGDPEKDAVFHRAVDQAQALALVPANPTTISLSFLDTEGVRMTPVGLVLPDDLGLDQWVNGVNQLRQVGDVSQFAMGDMLLYGEAKYGKQYDVVVDKFGWARSTVKNYRQGAAAWALDERVPGAGFYAHLYLASLKREDPALARNLLEQMVREGHSEAWVKQQAALARGREATPTPAQRRTTLLETLAETSTEQFERDLEELGTPAAVQQRLDEDLEALVAQADVNDLVQSDIVRRNVTRLAGRIHQLEAERDHWRTRAEAAEARLAELGEAQMRVAEHADPLAFITGNATVDSTGVIEGEYTDEGAADEGDEA
jgi:hypothetical protein